jgi:hypothetical protein
VVTAVIVGFSLGWITSIVVKTHVVPELLGVGGFMTVFYGVNKFQAWAMKREDKAQ